MKLPFRILLVGLSMSLTSCFFLTPARVQKDLTYRDRAWGNVQRGKPYVFIRDYEYKPFGIELGFTPRVVDTDRINLQLEAAVSGIDNSVTVQTGGVSVNAFRRREASTVVEMRDGESFAIAGLLQDDFEDLAGQVPWLGDIPILGALFRSSSYERRQSELVIIITAHLVSPTSGDALALPTDRVRPPTEAELFLFGRTVSGNRNAPPGPAGEVAQQDFNGSYGYVMD